MPFFTIANELILAWTILLLAVAAFTGYWSWLFYRQLTDSRDPMGAAFMLREVAYTNMFLCFAVIRSLPLFGLAPLNIAYLVWGVASTLMVVTSYILLHRELSRQRQGIKRR